MDGEPSKRTSLRLLPTDVQKQCHMRVKGFCLIALSLYCSVLLFGSFKRAGYRLSAELDQESLFWDYATEFEGPTVNWSEVSLAISKRLRNKTTQRLTKASQYHGRMAADSSFLLTRSISQSSTGVIKKRLPEPLKLVAIQEGHGRLGNFMFRISSLIGIARRNNYLPVTLVTDDRTNLFAGLKLEVLDKTTALRLSQQEHLPEIRELGANIYSSHLVHFLRKHRDQSVIISGYLQSFKYFQPVQQEIRAMLTFTSNIYSDAIAVIERALRHLAEENKLTTYRRVPRLVGIHVRRTDMLSQYNRGVGYVGATQTYLVDTVQHVQAKYANQTVFVVLTDDPTYCRAVLGNFTNVVIPAEEAGPGNVTSLPEVDMAVLTLMDTVVMTVGSFGWWGAYLSDSDDVYYYKNWPRKKSSLAKFTRHRDYFPKKWHGRA